MRKLAAHTEVLEDMKENVFSFSPVTVVAVACTVLLTTFTETKSGLIDFSLQPSTSQSLTLSIKGDIDDDLTKVEPGVTKETGMESISNRPLQMCW